MILLDTSVWVEHLRSHQQSVADLLNQRDEVLVLLDKLPRSVVASEAEILHTIDQQWLMGRGIGYVDAGLITSCLLSSCRLWTLDRHLLAVAQTLGLAYPEP